MHNDGGRCLGREGGRGGGLKTERQEKGGENVCGRSQWAEPVLVKDAQLCNFVVETINYWNSIDAILEIAHRWRYSQPLGFKLAPQTLTEIRIREHPIKPQPEKK